MTAGDGTDDPDDLDADGDGVDRGGGDGDPDGEHDQDSQVGELARLFLRLGVTAFGGPAAHIAMMHDEVVRRRGWVSDERFVDLVGATNLIPGPNSTELAIHLGWDRARSRGLVVAGVCFIVPAAVIVGVLAAIYVRYGDTPALDSILYGIKPVVIAIVVQALLKLGPTAAKTWWLGALAVAAGAAYLLGVNELVLLATAGLLVAAVRAARTVRRDRMALWLPLAAVAHGRAPGASNPAVVAATSNAADVGLWHLFWVFLEIGSVLYGSGYVLLAFLQGELVDRLGWITSQQLLDAVSVGQVTPGPVFTTATFVGYLTAGFWGAVVATIAIFLPSFVFVALLTRIVTWMRASPTLGAALDGVNAAAVGLIAGVSVQLAGDAIVDVLTVGIVVATGVLLWRTQLNSAWLVACGAVTGVVHALVAG